MNDETLRVLEYAKIRNLLAGFTVSAPGRERALALAPLPVPKVPEALAEIQEMESVLASSSARPPVGGCDLRRTLRHLRVEGSWLPPEDLLEILVSAEAASECRRFFSGRPEAHRLTARAQLLASLKELRQNLRASLGPRGEILDSASFELGEIRRETLQTRNQIKRVLEGLLAAENLAAIFQERIITERNGRYVLPVRADRRGQLKGFVHDESASGQTLYLEPTAALAGNNRLQSLLQEERREEEAILRRLSELVRRESAALAENQEILAFFDYTAAAAAFSRLYAGEIPQLTDEPLLELYGARHPLLLFHQDGTPRGGAAVPIDLLLGAGFKILVVSGPNTGGKTVALKTVGLLLLMVRSGLPIPCRPGSRVHLFGRIFADIGDEQSIEANLSTFSGHLTRIRQILAAADEDSLVLLDEAGTGTDPAEGGALALAVLDTLRERGARTILTTHLNLIKGYAHLRPEVENAAVEFDSHTLAPSYRLHYGIPGASNAFTIARLLGIPEDVLAKAAGYIGGNEQEGMALIEDLNRLRKDLAREREDAQRLTAEARRERDRRRQLLRELEEQQKTLLEKTARRGEERLREAERNLKTLLRKAEQSAQTTVAPPERARLAEELHSVKADVASLRPLVRRGKTPVEPRTGEILRIPALDAEGEVVRVANGEVELSLQGKKLRLPLHDLEQPSPRRFATRQKSSKVRSNIVRDSFQPRLLLVGKRIDEALLLVDRFLDDALLHGMREVEVVHGSGEGVLRRAVRDFLAGHAAVAAFRGGDTETGGENVTIVEMRET